MTTKSPAMLFFVNGHEPASVAGSKDIARPSGNGQFQASFTALKPSRTAVHDVGLLADPQSAFRTLTGVRFRPVDESASCIGAGEL